MSRDNHATATDPRERRTLRIDWFGTSIMEHLEAYNRRLVQQADLPAVGSVVTVEGWYRRGYVHRLHLALQASRAHVTFDFRNHGEGGATSRDIARTIRRATADGARFDLAFVGVGVNDVWRGFQAGRAAEAVAADEYGRNYAAILEQLTACSRTTVCITETPFGPAADPDQAVVGAMNRALAHYNQIAEMAARAAGVLVVDVWDSFESSARHLAAEPADRDAPTLWSDGVHLSELGDALMLHHIASHLETHHIIGNLLDEL